MQSRLKYRNHLFLISGKCYELILIELKFSTFQSNTLKLKNYNC